MQITSKPETITVTYRCITVTFPTRILDFVLNDDDKIEQDDHSLTVLYANGKKATINTAHALAVETETITREEPVNPPVLPKQNRQR